MKKIITIVSSSLIAISILLTIYLISIEEVTTLPANRQALAYDNTRTEREVLPTFHIQIREPKIDIEEILLKWKNKNIEPIQWGENVPGVKTRLDSEEKVIALTFDACGGPYGSSYDEHLIDFLREERIPASLFFNARWIRENEEIFIELSNDPLFTIENHGTEHLPLSVQGGTAWGITATNSVEKVIDEVLGNQDLIHNLTGEKPLFFRSGTAFYDEYAVKIVNDLGLTVVNYNVLGDAGATFSSSQVRDSLINAQPGSIVLLHMNQPSSGTAEGVMEAIPILKAEGYRFVTLHEYSLVH
ncbi:polysaccharide deacetylase family protein [Evansella sp. AB-rgal1]|uniref:polysaccharide deacetylase family protein n=1 Tax=Evansella sp. AB-rgal1 TaxID=3242696 RepID=UPI00359E0A29